MKFTLKKIGDSLNDKLTQGFTFFIEKEGPIYLFVFSILSILIEMVFVQEFSIDNHTYVSQYLVPVFLIILLFLRLICFLLADTNRIFRFASFLVAINLIKYGLFNYSFCEPTNDSYLKLAAEKLSQSIRRSVKHESELARIQGTINFLEVSIYSQLALPVSPYLGLEFLLKNPEQLIKYSPQRLGLVALTTAGGLTAIRMRQTRIWEDIRHKQISEESLQEKYRFLEQLIRHEPAKDMSTDFIHNIGSFSQSQLARMVADAPLISNQQSILVESSIDLLTGISNLS